MRGDEQDTIDERIDAELRRYAEAPQFSEPRVALARVRALAEQQLEPRWNIWMWVVPSSLMAVLIAVVVVWALRIPRTPQIAWVPKAPGVANVEAPAHSEPTPKTIAGPSTRDSNRCCGEPHGAAIRTLAQDEAPALPKQEVFPTPQPLSQEEQALVAFAVQAPPDVTRQVIEAQKHLGDPIQIAALTIRPLDEEEQNAEPKGKENQ